MDGHLYKDVVIIGNGPSAITLSYFLSGNWPYYNGIRNPFIPDYLQDKLCENITYPIVKQDLNYLSEGLEGRSPYRVSILMDTLQHPGADTGEEIPSVLNWKYHPSEVIDHVVVGCGLPGGAWHKMEGSILTLSKGSWMELPNLKIKEWNKERDNQNISAFKDQRTTVSTVRKYYLDYVNNKHLNNNFINNFRVTNIQQNGEFWNVKGISQENGKMLCFKTPRVVVATGNSDSPNRLHIKGEFHPFVMHSLTQLEKLLRIESSQTLRGHSILIVGAGLSAADAIIAARFHGLSVVHVFRKDVLDPKLIFEKLPTNMYPEYHKVYQMMCSNLHNSNSYENYNPYPAHTVELITSEGQVVIKSILTQKLSLIKVTHILVLIGMSPDLSFLPDLKLGIDSDLSINCHTNPIKINSMTYESTRCPGLHAMGPLVGDTFVRFVQGGALAITANILKQKRKRV